MLCGWGGGTCSAVMVKATRCTYWVLFSNCFTLGDGAVPGLLWASSGRSHWAGRASDFFCMRREPMGEVAWGCVAFICALV